MEYEGPRRRKRRLLKRLCPAFQMGGYSFFAMLRGAANSPSEIGARRPCFRRAQMKPLKMEETTSRTEKSGLGSAEATGSNPGNSSMKPYGNTKKYKPAFAMRWNFQSGLHRNHLKTGVFDAGKRETGRKNKSGGFSCIAGWLPV